jgi:hypothetical protein
MRAWWVCLAIGLCACKAPSPSPSTVSSTTSSNGGDAAPTIAAASSSTTSSSPIATVAPSTPSLTLLPRAAPNKTAIVDCKPSDPSDTFSCCSEEHMSKLEKLAEDREPSECKRMALLPNYRACPAFFARGFHRVVEACLTLAMNRELDRRLLPLKEVDVAQFHREMELQKHFNQALWATVDAILLAEPSTSDFHDSFRAAVALLEYRTKQAEAQNRGELAITREPAGPAEAARFKAFAQALCASTPLWKAGTPPTDCEARVRGEIADAMKRNPGL